MKCQHCGGRLEGDLIVCGFCGTRQEIDLRQVNHRDLGPEGELPCPGCEAVLDVIEFELQPPVRVERCHDCQGLFFNPGELEAVLDGKTADTIWVDREKLHQLTQSQPFEADFRYLRCPLCRELMSRSIFGGRSGVIIDRCAAHGIWLEGGELQRLLEWWHAGGKHLHAEHQQGLARSIRPPIRMKVDTRSTGGGSGRTAYGPVNVLDMPVSELIEGALAGIASLFDG